MRVKIEYGASFPEVVIELIPETEEEKKEIEELKRTIREFGIENEKFDVKIEKEGISFVWGV